MNLNLLVKKYFKGIILMVQYWVLQYFYYYWVIKKEFERGGKVRKQSVICDFEIYAVDSPSSVILNIHVEVNHIF